MHARAVGRRVVAVRQLGLRARCGRLRARGGRERGERAAVAVGAVHVRAAEQPGGGAGKRERLVSGLERQPPQPGGRGAEGG